MSAKVIVFEDQTWSNFRPLCLSMPTYELRMGMFNTRERVELTQKHLGNSDNFGTLLCRDNLAPLHTCQGWEINPDILPGHSEGYLWLNGRSWDGFASILEMLTCPKDSPLNVIVDDHGLVAAHLSSEDSVSLHQSWLQWQNDFRSSGQDGQWDGLSALNISPAGTMETKALSHIWDLVPATAEILADDLNFVSSGKGFARHPFGIFAQENNDSPFWNRNTVLKQASSDPVLSAQLASSGLGVWLGENVKISPGVILDTSQGAIILDRDVEIMPHCYLEGPLYAGPGCRFKAGSTIYGKSSFGLGNRLSGEIGESTFGDFANKQHDGFIGHAVLGAWTNLGAMTTCSDLKNNYGNVRVDLGSGTVDSGLRFVGLFLGDHVKTAIGTLFNTGTTVGFASNIFGAVMPPTFVGNFSWGGLPDRPAYDVEKAIETATIVMGRRGCRMVEATKKLMRSLA